MSPINTLVPVIDLPFLASEVNDAHRQVAFHAKSMLLEAKRAGEALLEAKKLVKHGEFKAWVEEHCRCSYSTAADYMKVSRHWQKLGAHDVQAASIRQALAQIEERKSTPPVTSMDATDAEYILKLHAMAERASPNEAAIASRKLAEWVGKAFAVSSEAAIAQAQALLPDNDKSSEQRDQNEKLRKAEARLAEVEAKLERMMNRKAELRCDLGMVGHLITRQGGARRTQ